MRIGFQLPYSGNLKKLETRIRVSRGNAFQVYARSKRGIDGEGNPYPLHELSDKNVNMFKSLTNSIYPAIVHAPLSHNLAQKERKNKQGEQWSQVECLIEELAFCQRLGCDYYVLNAGHSKTLERDEAIQNIRMHIEEALGKSDFEGNVLIRNAAGAGTELAADLEEWSRLVSWNPRVKGALDLGRAYAYGHSFFDEKETAAFIKELDDVVGFDHIKMVYINDSKRGRGAQKESPTILGEGFIHFSGYECILEHPVLQALPWMLEHHPVKLPDLYDRSLEFLKDRRGRV
ncbi:TIM barrel protein (plasmid) [Pontibacillus sp. ALD_SL1]|uniref:TIM barrel protein n=1 Tax=Pontibacillus sp. ALD_SL1 TaxID=2777185 RepID=UPI001A977880|nr:TIM barrel protein [Pontibacillus sp. ALD_SL1]QST03078.1 TIM barrel protein [Pontibacillus sp. ALD_SL1]